MTIDYVTGVRSETLHEEISVTSIQKYSKRDRMIDQLHLHLLSVDLTKSVFIEFVKLLWLQ